MKTLETLNAYVESVKFRKYISSLVRTLPNNEKYKLVDQLLRASRSIPANIAEGYGRFHYRENIQFVRIARGSLYECKEHFSCAYDEKYITKDELDKFNLHFDSLLKLLNGYISFMKSNLRK